MRLVSLPGKILINRHHTLIVMHDGGCFQAVCVVNDSMIGDVRCNLALLETIASRKLDGGELAFDGRIWITASDLAETTDTMWH
ncbi:MULTISPECIES: hypothetical protein [unclassified Rhizobium]|uniref:hypothetical protein n=1 Tax=unclassified Rhizobium TaxID=2613769 RepID=UPI0006FB01E6|nr:MULTISPECIES: hypothetical protein [unclassified Rhizobium]KQV42690.1 hypothetical protein ASC86_18665 [Rhizobium sp. Root1212]KRD36422.1 hypothetical protein ASE37_19650 [Rhizobium sp. Root268]